jgi:2-C-methyl-D-erythritol 4-phosphate cytidylyltransferase
MKAGLPAAGLGTRMGRTSPERAGTSRKQFMLLDGAPILLHTIRKFMSCPSVTEVVVALRARRSWSDNCSPMNRLPGRRPGGGVIRASSRWRTRWRNSARMSSCCRSRRRSPFIDPATIERLSRAASTGAAIVGIVRSTPSSRSSATR